MKKIIKQLSLGALSVLSVAAMSGGAAFAQSSGLMQTNLNQMNGSGASGTSSVEMLGNNQVRVRLNMTGSSPNLPHAQHLHIGGTNECPTIQADTDKDGLINTKEGEPAYGPVKTSLTTEGDVGEGRALAVEMMPKADANGIITYDRTFTLPAGVTEADVRKAVVVNHGISELFGDKAKYDGEKKSSLDPKLPLEATIPAACGALASTPVGSVAAGFEPASKMNNVAPIALGAISLAAAGVLIARRRAEN